MKEIKLSERIARLIEQVQIGVVGKNTAFNLGALALLAEESIFLLGRPGIAKSLLARRMKFLLEKGSNFEYLMNRFSAPEEIFGPISITALQQGSYERNVDNYLPTANIAFLDEIWKAGPSIQNTLLTIINEKIYLNGNKTLKVPLRLLISASNELPTEGEGLEALFDRFLIRLIVTGVSTQNQFDTMILANTPLEAKVDKDLQITEAEYVDWVIKTKEIKIDKETLVFIARFREHISTLTKGTSYISDRRWKKIFHLMQTSAFFNDRDKVDKPDWLIVAYCIWDNEQQERQYTKIFNEFLVENLLLEIHAAKEDALVELNEIQEALGSLSEEDMIKNVYSDIFNSKVKGRFYRLLAIQEEYPICFISVNDYRKLKKKPNGILRFYLGNDLRKLQTTINKNIRILNDAVLIDEETNAEYYLEIKDAEKTDLVNSLTQRLNKAIETIEHLDVKLNQEKNRLKKIKNIFFQKEWELKINQIFDFAVSAEQEADKTESSKNATSDQDAIE